ncbi:MAG: hypothetical protein HYY40_03160 [Bacteroidetes bacterium]|nr:hypothetical protein [Bacteroidota bacterium]
MTSKRAQRVKVPYALRYIGEALASRKVVWSNPCTEVSGTVLLRRIYDKRLY